MIKPYKKRPVEILACQWDGTKSSADKIVAWAKEHDGDIDIHPNTWGLHPRELSIATLEGEMVAHPGDYIIKGVKDEFYPCRKDIFEETYVESVVTFDV